MDLSGLCARPFGSFPNAGGGASATITGYNQATGVLSGIAPPGLLVVLTVAGAYSASTLANAQGQWSIPTNGIGGQSIAVAVVPLGTVYLPGGPGSQAFSAPGSISFVVPNYRTMIVELTGGGGGGAPPQAINGSNGTSSTISSLSLVGGYGTGGVGGSGGTNGSGTASSGGDVNTTAGNSGAAAGPNGGAVGGSGSNGSSPGGGGGGTYTSGGGGSYCKKTYAFGASGAPVPGSTLSGVVGTGGAGASGCGAGAAGQIKYSWS